MQSTRWHSRIGVSFAACIVLAACSTPTAPPARAPGAQDAAAAPVDKTPVTGSRLARQSSDRRVGVINASGAKEMLRDRPAMPDQTN